MVIQVSDEVIGFGSIELVRKDPEVTEAIVNGSDDVYMERGAHREGQDDSTDR